MRAYDMVKKNLIAKPDFWLVTGVAGFIGSNLLEALLKLNQQVVGLDNFDTGHQHNLDEVRSLVTPVQWENFRLIEGDIRNFDDCVVACKGASYVLHQAALGSVARSIEDPVNANKTNVEGFLNMLIAARDANVSRFVYAASSSSYGDYDKLPKVEDKIGKPLSPYAVTKLVNELYAHVFSVTYGLEAIGLRYFNVFGKRQDPNGPYAAVIPKWISAMINNEPVYINGDGETSRDFCHVENAIQANLLAALVDNKEAVNEVYNVAVGGRTTLNQLFEAIRQNLSANDVDFHQNAIYKDFRSGDIRHSVAEIEKARQLLGYEPVFDIVAGLAEVIVWYKRGLAA